MLAQKVVPTQELALPQAIERDLRDAANAALDEFRLTLCGIYADAVLVLPLPVWAAMDSSYSAGYTQALADAANLLMGEQSK